MLLEGSVVGLLEMIYKTATIDESLSKRLSLLGLRPTYSDNKLLCLLGTIVEDNKI